MTPGGRAGGGGGCGARRVQNSFCTNIVMLHIELKVIKSRIQWCKKCCPGACLRVTRGGKVGFWVLFFIVTQLLLGFLARTKLLQVIALWIGGAHSEF